MFLFDLQTYKYFPKFKVDFNVFDKFVTSLGLELNSNGENIDFNEIKLKMFQWFNIDGSGRITFQQFQQRLLEFFVENNTDIKKTSKGKKPAKSKKKNKKKKAK